MIAIAVMILGIGVAVAILYSGTGQTFGGRKSVRSSSSEVLLRAIPSDAALVACVSDAGDVFEVELQERMAVSLHYAGNLSSLYVFDAGQAGASSDAYVKMLIQAAKEKGLKTECIERFSHCLVLASASESLIASSVRHMDKEVSILDAEGFMESLGNVSARDYVLVNCRQSSHLAGALMNKRFLSYSSFFADLTDWASFEIESKVGEYVRFDGKIDYDRSASNFMNVFASASSGKSEMADVLPSVTCFAMSFPSGSYESYIESYDLYLASCRKQSMAENIKAGLKSQTGMDPDDYLKVFDVKEVATASFRMGGSIERVNLIRIGNRGFKALIGSEKADKDQNVTVRPFRYGSFLASVFGDVFSLEDETSFVFINGWVISGSEMAVSGYVDGHILDYTLNEYLGDSGMERMMSSSSSLLAYMSLSGLDALPSSVFAKRVSSILKKYSSSCDHIPSVLTIRNEGKCAELKVEMASAHMHKSSASASGQDNTVVVPEGPFRVKNSGTGKMNIFCQNKEMSLCLQEEDGTELWNVPFDEPLCGRATTIDNFANGKLQIIFAAGTKIHLIDRLGRFVKGFPIDLMRKVRLGPDVYDFNGARKYNVMVLHDDNTIDMYNLKGQKPASWKSITSADVIKTLPERIVVGGSSFWVVRTSLQTLIFPFYGGEPLTVFEQGEMIRPDSRITVLDGMSVSAECYDGKVRTIKLK